jgi:hypothetical protein
MLHAGCAQRLLQGTAALLQLCASLRAASTYARCLGGHNPTHRKCLLKMQAQQAWKQEADASVGTCSCWRVLVSGAVSES